MGDSPTGSVLDVTVDDMQVDDDEIFNSKIFQKDNWRLRFLPYYDELVEEADKEFSSVKTTIAKGIIDHDIRPGFTAGLRDLIEYINVYQKRFTKSDHIRLVNLLYNVLVLKGLDFRVVRMVSQTINVLLNKKMFITREDLRIPWRPLYDLYHEVAFKKLEEDGLILFPEGLKEKIELTISNLHDFFEDGATQEILDLVRPNICPFDDTVNQAIITAVLFLPTCLKAEEHEKFGAKLWFDELFYWFSSGEFTTENEDRILGLLVQLAIDCPFYIDWTDKLDWIFDRLMKSCGLHVSQTEIGTDFTSVSVIATLLAYIINGSNNIVIDKLTGIFQTWEDFFHPSNSGSHLNQLIGFVSKLVTSISSRISRERYNAKKHYNQIPSDKHITDTQIDLFVKSLLPCLNYAAFAKTKQDVPRIFRYCAFLAPGIVLPQLLDLIYPALENITEPHRLHQTLNIFMQILVPLARDQPAPGRERLEMTTIECSNDRSLRSHFITLLNNILPGLDVNDITKSAMTFQIIATIFCLMPLVDCSEALYIRDDLTDEERELCSATANFEGIIDQILSKCFSIIDASTSGNISNARPFHMEHYQKTTEEVLHERGIYVVIKQLCRSCSSSIFDFTMNLFFEFIKDRIFDTRTTIDSVCRLTIVFVTTKPKVAFPKFFNYARSRLQSILSPTSASEEELSHGILWFYTLTCEVLSNVRGDVILEHKDEILSTLDTLLEFKCPDAYLRASAVLENILRMLVSIYPNMDEYYLEINDQPLDKYLPIRNWAKTVKKAEWDLKWHIPTPQEVDLAELILQKYLFTSLSVLREPEKLKDKEIQKYLNIVQNSLFGSCTILPFFEGENLIHIYPNEKEIKRYSCITMPSHIRRIKGPNGENLRALVYGEIKRLTLFLLENAKNDTKSFKVITSVINTLLLCEGVDPMSYAVKAAHYTMKKKILNDPIRGERMLLESQLEDNIYFLHQRRLFSKPMPIITELHADALSLLVTLGTSLYADTRIRAQQVLELCLSQVPYLYNLVIDQVLNIIRNQQTVSHEEFKGALYILINGKKTSLCLKQDWSVLLKIWPTMIKAQQYEKPSIIALFDFIVQQITQSFESFLVSYTLPDDVLKYAISLIEDYDGNHHKALISIPTDDDLKKAKEFEKMINESNLNNYLSLCQSLYSVCIDRTLHWRHIDMAQSLTTLMFRRDIHVPDEIIKLFMRLLVHDTLQTRKAALTIITSWQKIVKVRSKKIIYPINVKLDNVGPGAKWPIKYGLRKDNVQLIYDMDKHPQTPEEYNNTCYFTKWHTGFYTWPKEFKVLAPLNEQLEANREIENLNSLEKDVLSILSEPEFLKKLFSYYSMEEKKGSDSFIEMNYQLFYRLFRNLGPTIFTLIEPYLDKLIASKKEGEQRFASEIVSALIMATKLWKYERVLPIVEWLRSRLLKCFETMTDEAESNWCTSIANVFCRIDLRQVNWLYEIVFDLVRRAHDSGFHTTFRLKLLHSSIVQYEWRVPHLFREVFKQSAKFVAKNSQFLRGRVGSILASCTIYDVKGIYVDPDIKSIYHPMTNADIVSIINRELYDLIWKEVLTDGLSQLKHIWGTEFTNTIQKLAIDSNNGQDSPPGSVLKTSSVETPDNNEKMDTTPVVTTAARQPIIAKTPRPIKSNMRRASTPPLSITRFTGSDTGRKREKAMIITLVNCVYSCWASSSADQLYPSFELFPLFVHYANDIIDEELRTSCEELVISEMGCSFANPNLADHVLKIVKLTVLYSCTWKTRCTTIRFLQIHIFANLHVYKNGFVDRIMEILDYLLMDSQIEVRTNAGLTVSGFIQCGLFNVDSNFLKKFIEWSESTEIVRRHAGVLGLSATITAAPYKVPSYMPDVLMKLCKHMNEPQPINLTVKRTLNEFKRTHLDCWKDHKNQFNEDQLTVLTNLLVSPNYYV